MARFYFMQFIWVACLLSVVLATPSDFGDDEDVDQIIGGTAAPKGTHQYFVHLRMYPVGATNYSTTCGGTLINSKTIMTAAHCVDQGPYGRIDAVFRTWNILPEDASAIKYQLTSPTIRIHPGWYRPTLIHDIALIILPTAVPLLGSAYVDPANGNKIYWIEEVFRPACNDSFEGVVGTAIGYGLTKNQQLGGQISKSLQQVPLTILSAAECTRRWGTTYYTHESQLCAADVGKSICFGDGGGPLVVNGVQVGINLYVSTAGCDYLGGGFVRVSYYKNWIEANMAVV